MEQYTDEQIIEGISQNDRKVMNYIYDRFYGKVEGFIRGRGGNPEHIKDVFQEAIYVIIKKVREEGLTLTCTFSTYLLAVCKNIWMHDMRKNKVHLVEDSRLDSIPEEDAVDWEQEEKFRALYNYHFSQLSEDCQKLLLLHFGKVSLAEIQQIFGYSSEHYTSDRKYRCKQSLFNRIRKDPKFKEITDDR
jgi:RNA polymerase sigma factor (sigma-70 family)